MTQSGAPAGPVSAPPTATQPGAGRSMGGGKRAAVIGLGATAAMFLLLAGILQFLQGLAAVIHDDFFVVGPNYTYELDVTAWGWIHLVLGVLLAVIGLALLYAATWARIAGIALAILSAMANFMFIPFYPVWAIIIIAIDVAIIWALCNYRRAIDD